MKLNIDRLHDVMANKLTARQSGRTFTMLVLALQQADFYVTTITIVSKNNQHLNHIKNMFLKIAKQMEYEIDQELESAIKIMNSWFFFKTTDTTLSGHDNIFLDHLYVQ